MKKIVRQWLYRIALGAANAGEGKEMRRYSLGVLKLDRLGDAVLALGAVRRMLRDFDEADTLLVVSPLAEPLFRSEFPAAAILVLPPFSYRFAPDYLTFLLRHSAHIRGLRVERLVCLRHQPSDHLHSVARLLRPKATYASEVKLPWERVSLSYPNARLAPYPEAVATQCRELEAHRRVVEMAVGKPVALDEVMPRLQCAEAEDGAALLVCPDAGDPLRMYPAPRLADAVRRFLALRSVPVEVCLPPSVSEAPWRAAFQLAGVSVRSWHRPKDAVALSQVIAAAGVVLANETAPAHLAAALDKRGAFLIGGGHFGLLAPWHRSERQRWIYNPMDCYDCRWNCIHSEPRCITELAPERIAETLAQALAA